MEECVKCLYLYELLLSERRLVSKYMLEILRIILEELNPSGSEHFEIHLIPVESS